MMKELSLNILDICENSTRAKATLVELLVEERPADDTLRIEVTDNGSGMDADFVKTVQDPFTTTRTTRKVGLGIPFFKEAAEATGGAFALSSTLGEGTKLSATFGYSHIDRMPLGDMASTVSTLVQGHAKEIDFVYTHRLEDKEFRLDTRELRSLLGDVPLNEPQVIFWIRDYIQENLDELCGGTKHEIN